MDIPEDLHKLINDYARPMTKPNWKDIKARPEHWYAMIEYLIEQYDDYILEDDYLRNHMEELD